MAGDMDFGGRDSPETGLTARGRPDEVADWKGATSRPIGGRPDIDDEVWDEDVGEFVGDPGLDVEA